MRAAPHQQQAERLDTLRRYDVLDTPREEDFDEIVRLASRICETPISVINLIDEARQWFKAEVGLGARETPLETSICSHVILDDDYVEIEDTLKDGRMADNPLCLADPGLRFYAGARLVGSNGLPIGTLCVLDNKPRRLTDLQRDALQVLSRQVMKQFELRLALKNQAVLKAEMDHRIKNAMQSVAAVARVYGRSVQDTDGKHAVEAIQRHIAATAALHQELQAAEDGATVQGDEYLARIIALMRDAAPKSITLIGICDPLPLEARQAGALGVIVSEFVANACKHGFPDGRTGTVRVALTASEVQGAIILRCNDDGVGSAGGDGGPVDGSGGIGQSLIAAAASNLGAVVDSGLTDSGGFLTLEFRAASK